MNVSIKDFCFGFNATQVALGHSIAVESKNITEAWMTKLLNAGLDAQAGGAVLLVGVAKAYGCEIKTSQRGRFNGYTLTENTAAKAFERLYNSIYNASNGSKSKSNKPGKTKGAAFLSKVKAAKKDGLTYRTALAALNEAYGL